MPRNRNFSEMRWMVELQHNQESNADDNLSSADESDSSSNTSSGTSISSLLSLSSREAVADPNISVWESDQSDDDNNSVNSDHSISSNSSSASANNSAVSTSANWVQSTSANLNVSVESDSDSSLGSISSAHSNSDDNSSSVSRVGSFVSDSISNASSPSLVHRSPSIRGSGSDEDSELHPFLRLRLPSSPNPSERSQLSFGSFNSIGLAVEDHPVFEENNDGLNLDFLFGGSASPAPGTPSSVEYSPPGTPSDRDSSSEQHGNTAAYNPTTYTMAGPSATCKSGASQTTKTSFECCVCLEMLDAPASIDDSNVQNGVVVQSQSPPASIPGSSRGRSSSRGRGGVNRSTRGIKPIATLTDVVAAYCGHLYHQVCLEKWFSEQGKRTCPSCRKTVPPTKLIRLYPSISQDPVQRFPTDFAGNDGPGPSSSTGVCNVVPNGNTVSATVTSPTQAAPKAPLVIGIPGTNCGNPDCQDLKMIHNTLINDYNDLQRRYDTLRENDDMKEAQIQSLEEDNNRKTVEVDRLKRELEETRTGHTGSASGAKRRRQ